MTNIKRQQAQNTQPFLPQTYNPQPNRPPFKNFAPPYQNRLTSGAPPTNTHPSEIREIVPQNN